MRVLASIATVAAAVACLGATPASATEPRTFAFMSSAGGLELERLREFGRCVDVVAPNWYSLERPGGRVSVREPDAAVVAATRRSGTELWPVVNARFSGIPLERPAVRRHLAGEVSRLAERHGYDGVTLDIEGLAPSLRDAYSALIERTDRALARDERGLAVYVPRRTSSPPNDTAAPYDWAALSGSADLVLASGYNEHYSGGSAGPITTSAGFAEVLDYAAGISTDRIAPTAGAFGYRWPFNGRPGKLVSAHDVETDPPSVVGSFSDGAVTYLTGRSVTWAETADGLAARRQAAAERGFEWLGLFSLGREPRSFWSHCG